jgi:mannose-6-phosphate isomerase-like protein (cupin superfamily)
MRCVSKDDIKQPFSGPTGEIIYEMIGRPAAIGGTEKHSFVHVVIPPGASSQAHFHKNSEETYFGLSGSGRLRVGADQCRLTPGTACLIMPGAIHHILNDTDADLEFIAVSAPAWVPEDTYYAEFEDSPAAG